MATPTPMKSNPSQQGQRQQAAQGQTPQFAAGSPPVSTPFSINHNAAFSPRGGGGPRSSPQYVKKSPATTTGLAGATGANGPLNFDSPSAAAAMGALGMGGGLDMGLDNVGVGGLGGLQGLGVLGGEDERLKRLDSVIEILSRKKGYVSEEGLERLVDRIGLEKIWDDYTMEGANGQPVKMKNLVVAGSALGLDITLDNHIVKRVALAFPLTKDKHVKEYTERAEAILLRDLQLEPGQSPLTKTLDKFAANLERLSSLDKLSSMPWLDLQEGLAGICASLQKIHEWDMQKIRADPAMAGKTEKYMLNVATCTRHGHPVMHTRERVGLTLDYWIQRHRILPKTRAMEKWVSENEGIWSLLIGCSPMGEIVYNSVRISDAWVSPQVEKEDPSTEDMLQAAATAATTTMSGTVLDWQEPPPTVNGNVFPEVIFKAFLEPPLILPQPVRVQLLQMVGMETTFPYPQTTFDSLFFPLRPGAENHDPSAPRTLSHCRDVVVRPRQGVVGGEKKGSTTTTARHKNTLYVYKPVYGQVLSEIPFSHPKQLIAMLPTFRQYAFLATLLKRSFSTPTPPAGAADDSTGSAAAAADDDESSSAAQKRQGLDDFFSARGASSKPSSSTSNNNGHAAWSPNGAAEQDQDQGQEQKKKKNDDDAVLPIDVTLTVHPVLRLNVVFPLGPKSANLHVEVGPNGKVRVVSQNILPDDVNGVSDADAPAKGKGRRYTAEDLALALELFEDIDEWCQWIRTRVGLVD